ncbi:chymotrypsin-C-like [Huso huso]|uniref:Chymotrypsin-C-like n=1 Tax=Huso huso TaxID=61971 RepID=A0ABR1AD20_HUSHU
MIPIVLVVFLFASAYGCGVPAIQPAVSRVVNGVDAIPHSWPWQVRIQVIMQLHTCGGSLIATNWVLTAAHCINKDLTYRVEVGKQNLKEVEAGSKAIAADKLFVHEKWNPIFVAFGNDVALVKLAEHVTLSDSIRLACIPEPEAILPNNQPCYITGWGRLYSKDMLCCEICFTMDHHGRQGLGCDGIVGGCNGDSGGPLNCRNSLGIWEVHGIASFVSGLGCNYIRKPTVFTRVSAFNGWIDQTISAN